MDVSVVIPTFNRAGLIGTTIPALMNQQVGEFSYEVVFVSNGSSDNTEAVLSEAAARYDGKLRYVVIAPTGGPAAPRNVGIRAARGNAIVILDDDVLPDPDLVLRHAEFHRDHPEAHQAAVGEVYVPPQLLHDPISLFHTFPYDELRSLERLSYLHFWTCNVSFKRQFMIDAGGFDERFLYFEDIICGHRLAARGMHLRLLSSARGQHLHQLKAAGVPAKGWFTGVWLYATEQHIPERVIKERFGIVSPSLGRGTFLLRLLRRAAARSVYNPATLACLGALAKRLHQRSSITDLYYTQLFRSNVRAGYQHAEREARRCRTVAPPIQDPRWIDRGES